MTVTVSPSSTKTSMMVPGGHGGQGTLRARREKGEVPRVAWRTWSRCLHLSRHLVGLDFGHDIVGVDGLAGLCAGDEEAHGRQAQGARPHGAGRGWSSPRIIDSSPSVMESPICGTGIIVANPRLCGGGGSSGDAARAAAAWTVSSARRPCPPASCIAAAGAAAGRSAWNAHACPPCTVRSAWPSPRLSRHRRTRRIADSPSPSWSSQFCSPAPNRLFSMLFSMLFRLIRLMHRNTAVRRVYTFHL